GHGDSAVPHPPCSVSSYAMNIEASLADYDQHAIQHVSVGQSSRQLRAGPIEATRAVAGLSGHGTSPLQLGRPGHQVRIEQSLLDPVTVLIGRPRPHAYRAVRAGQGRDGVDNTVFTLPHAGDHRRLPTRAAVVAHLDA